MANASGEEPKDGRSGDLNTPLYAHGQLVNHHLDEGYQYAIDPARFIIARSDFQPDLRANIFAADHVRRSDELSDDQR
jgi:hypothetical protein